MTFEQIRETLARHMAAARHHTPFGTLFAHDLRGLYRRTASDCGVTVAEVKEAAYG